MTSVFSTSWTEISNQMVKKFQVIHYLPWLHNARSPWARTICIFNTGLKCQPSSDRIWQLILWGSDGPQASGLSVSRLRCCQPGLSSLLHSVLFILQGVIWKLFLPDSSQDRKWSSLHCPPVTLWGCDRTFTATVTTMTITSMIYLISTTCQTLSTHYHIGFSQ